MSGEALVEQPVAAPDALALARPSGAVGDSLVVAGWTLVSRVTGVGRVIAIAAVLGPTFYGNTYQATNSLPNTIYYGLLGGSLLSSVLVPALVGHIDARDRAASERVAGGVLGVLLAGLAVALPLALLATPVLLEIGSHAGAGATAAAAQARVARVLLLMLLPQVFLYAVVGCSSAVMHSRRRFALAAAAPAMENIGSITTLIVVALVWGTGAAVTDVSDGELLVLGLGTTGAVAVHAALQWWGARRAGVVLRPRAGWRDPEVTGVLRNAAPSLAQAALGAVELLAVLFVANTVAGGVVAYQVAANFYFLPIALGATPVALSLLPRLSRLPSGGVYRDTFVRGLRFALFIAVPAAVATVVLAPTLARAIAFGRMSSGNGEAMVTAALLALGAGIIGETAFLVGTYSSYARGDMRSPLRSAGLKTAICLPLLAAALTVHGKTVVLVVGLAMSVSALLAATHRVGRLLQQLPGGAEPLLRPLLRTGAATLLLAGPLWLGGRLVLRADSRPAVLAAAGALVLAGAGLYLLAQRLLGAPEMRWLLGALRHDGQGGRR